MDIMKPIEYPILLAGTLSARDRAQLTADAAFLLTGEQAQQLASNENLWQYFVLDERGNIGVLKYRGVDVFVFFKRQVTRVRPAPVDPVPEAILDDPEDAWVRLELLGPSSRQVNARLRSRQQVNEEELQLLRTEVDCKAHEVATLQEENDKLHPALIKEKAAGIRIRNDFRDLREEQGKAQNRFLTSLLPLVTAISKGFDQSAELQDGYEKLFRLLDSMSRKMFDAFGVNLIKPKIGELFNYEKHHAVSTVRDVKMVGKITLVDRFGFVHDADVIEAAEVEVGVGGQK